MLLVVSYNTSEMLEVEKGSVVIIYIEKTEINYMYKCTFFGFEITNKYSSYGHARFKRKLELTKNNNNNKFSLIFTMDEAG